MFVLRSDVVADRSTEREMLATSLSGRQTRIANEQERYRNQRRADEQEAEGLARRLAALNARAAIAERQVSVAREVARREQRSHEEGLTSWVEASRPRLESDRLEAELEAIKGEIAEASAAAAGLRYRMASSRAAFDEVIRGVTEELDRARTRKDALDVDTSHTVGGLAVTAPCAGTIVRLGVRSPGVVVTESDLLAEIACTGVTLQAELLVPQRGFARLQRGQTVTLRYDAFPHERYGVRFATLGWISPASTVAENVPFRAMAYLDDQAVPVDGAPRDVLPGMGGQASILIGRRTLLSYVLEPVRALRNATVTERPRPEGGS
jgi:membrane fusion protein